MGNTPSTPPPLISIYSPGNEILVPYGTRLYAHPPPSAQNPHSSAHCKTPLHVPLPRGNECACRGPVFRAVQQRHGGREPDVRVRGVGSGEGEGSVSTALGERAGGGTGGYRGLRGGMGGVAPAAAEGEGEEEEGGRERRTPHRHHHSSTTYAPDPSYPDIHPHHPSYSPLPRYPPANHTPYPYPYTHPHSHPSHTSPPLPPAVQAAIATAVQQSNTHAPSRARPTRRSPFSAAVAEGKNEWGDGIDTCICTTECECRGGERGMGWYEGVADVGGEEVLVRGRLRTRWVRDGDGCGRKKKEGRGKRGGVRVDARSSGSGSSSETDADADASKVRKKKSRKAAQKADDTDSLNDLEIETNRLKHATATATAQKLPSFPRQTAVSPNASSTPPSPHKPKPPHRATGMHTRGQKQGTRDPDATRKMPSPRMPPIALGMRMHGVRGDDEDMYAGGASVAGLWVRRERSGKGGGSGGGEGRYAAGVEGRAGLGDGVFESESGEVVRPSRDLGGLGRRQPRRGRSRARFDFPDADVSPRRRRTTDTRCDDEHEYSAPKHGMGSGKEDGAPPRMPHIRVSPLGRRSGARNSWAAGRQAHAETDVDEDY